MKKHLRFWSCKGTQNKWGTSASCFLANKTSERQCCEASSRCLNETKNCETIRFTHAKNAKILTIARLRRFVFELQNLTIWNFAIRWFFQSIIAIYLESQSKNPDDLSTLLTLPTLQTIHLFKSENPMTSLLNQNEKTYTSEHPSRARTISFLITLTIPCVWAEVGQQPKPKERVPTEAATLSAACLAAGSTLRRTLAPVCMRNNSSSPRDNQEWQSNEDQPLTSRSVIVLTCIW